MNGFLAPSQRTFGVKEKVPAAPELDFAPPELTSFYGRVEPDSGVFSNPLIM